MVEDFLFSQEQYQLNDKGKIVGICPFLKLNLSFDKSIKIIEPLRYLDFLKLMKDSKLILSDSGGLQEEASILGVPCVTLRTTTERQITLIRNVNIIAGYNQNRILNAVKKFHNKKIKKIKDFGNGDVAEKIYKKLMSLK